MTVYSAPPYINRYLAVTASTTQPQLLPNIAKYSSINKNLLFYSSLHSRNLVDVMSGNLGSITGNPAYNTGPFGILPILASGTSISFPLVRNLDGNKPTTIMWQQKPINTTGYSAILNILPSINGTNSYLIYASASDTAYGFAAGLRNNSGSVANFEGPVPLLSNDSLDTYVLTLAAGMNDTSSTLSNSILWKNGVRILPNRFTTFSADSTATFKIGAAANGTDPFEGIIGSVGIWQRVLTDSECRQLSINTFSLLKPVPIFVGLATVISSITLTSAGDSTAQASATAVITTGVFTKTDISTTGWTGSPDNVVLSNNINEETSSTAEYIQSPAITGSQGPADFDLNNSLGVGTWEVDATFKYTLSAASVRFTLLNAGGTSVGDSGWIAASSVFAGYAPTITISAGTATKLRVEVQ